MRKVTIIILSLFAVFAFGGILTWGIINFNKVKAGLSGINLYTETDVNNAYDEGLNEGLKNKEDYEKLIKSYREQIADLTDRISLSNSKIKDLETKNEQSQEDIQNLTSQKQTLESQVEDLKLNKSQTEQTIKDLDKNIESLQQKISSLENDKSNLNITVEEKNTLINNYKSQISDLLAVKTSLEQTNAENTAYITELNSQITELQSEIQKLNLKISNNDVDVDSLRAEIENLRSSLTYYETYLDNINSEGNVVVTFEFDYKVYKVNLVKIGEITSVVTPESTDYIQFNYWMTDGAKIDLSTTTFDKNTKVIANVTYYHKVEFKSGSNVVFTKFIEDGKFSTTPTDPILSGYAFDGWTKNGVDLINVPEVEINEDTVFIAKFTKLHEIKFMNGDKVVKTEFVRDGNTISSYTLENTTYKIFDGWLHNNEKVDVSTIVPTGSTVLIAKWIYRYDINYLVDGNTFTSEIVTDGEHAVSELIPTKENYYFVGWSLDGTTVVDRATITITKNTTFIALFEKTVATVLSKSRLSDNLKYFNNFDSAWECACTPNGLDSQSILTLYTDISVDSSLTFLLNTWSIAFTLDLNGHTLTHSSPARNNVINDTTNYYCRSFTLCDSSESKSGVILGSVSLTRGSFNMTSGTIKNETTSTYGTKMYALVTSGNVSITGGTIESVKGRGIVIDGSIKTGLDYYRQYDVTISNCTIKSYAGCVRINSALNRVRIENVDFSLYPGCSNAGIIVYSATNNGFNLDLYDVNLIEVSNYTGTDYKCYVIDGFMRLNIHGNTNIYNNKSGGAETNINCTVYVYNDFVGKINTSQDMVYLAEDSLNGTILFDDGSASKLFEGDYKAVKSAYRITYKLKNGDVLHETTCYKGYKISDYPSPSKSGYVFIGWHLSAGDTSTDVIDIKNYIPTANTTFYACFINENLEEDIFDIPNL